MRHRNVQHLLRLENLAPGEYIMLQNDEANGFIHVGSSRWEKNLPCFSAPSLSFSFLLDP